MRKREAGQAFILVLILLAIGALLVIPALRLTTTVLKSNQAITQRNKGLYACEAAQEKILWLLYNDIDGIVSETLLADGDSISFTVDVCGTTVYAGITMRATEGMGGITLAAEHVIKPTKEVHHEYLPDPVPDKRSVEYTYTINLEQLSDNNTQGLDAIYDIPPGGFGVGAYQVGSSKLSLDGGQTWQEVPDPEWDHAMGCIKWPADYDKDTSEGAFSSDPLDANYFHGIRDFDVREVKKLRFKMRGTLDNNDTHCNWVVLKMEDGTNTLSGPQAPITVGDGSGECAGGGGLEVTKTSYPEIIQPGVATVVDYTIYVTSTAASERFIERVIDYLPPEFEYILGSVDNVTSTLTNLEPAEPFLEEVNGVLRERVEWTQEQFPGGNDVKIDPEETLTISFQALATKDISGSYYNEVLIFLRDTGIPGVAFDEAGVSQSEYGTGYSWNTGTVIVPAYDASTGAEGENITANIGFELDQVRIISWHAK
ncbi:MAG TPA: hypothetical protein VMW00_05435 [Dehalococcoidales bacterium]|nr:hypothetical protein [Dehalococcoidales bacterium]